MLGESSIQMNIEVLEAAKYMLGKPGPFIIDSHVHDHGHYDDATEQGLKNDKVKVGVAGKEVTMAHIISAFRKISKLEYDEGTTYIYEGIRRQPRKNIFDVLWGT